ncbi:MAG: hypothetical protein ACLT8E_02275 [Akkermansia sp.]
MTASPRYLFNGERAALDELFLRYGNSSHKAHISLVGGDGMHMQSVPVGNGLYYCEVGMTPMATSAPMKCRLRNWRNNSAVLIQGGFLLCEGRLELLRTFRLSASGDGQMDWRRGPDGCRHCLAFTGLPEVHTVHLSCMLDTFTRFLLS